VMCAVRPQSFEENLQWPNGHTLREKYKNECVEWVVQQPQDVRPYGLIFKEIP